jgi:hypothetical protein
LIYIHIGDSNGTMPLTGPMFGADHDKRETGRSIMMRTNKRRGFTPEPEPLESRVAMSS